MISQELGLVNRLTRDWLLQASGQRPEVIDICTLTAENSHKTNITFNDTSSFTERQQIEEEKVIVYFPLLQHE